MMHSDDKAILLLVALAVALVLGYRATTPDTSCATDCLSKGFKPVECRDLCE